MHNYDFLNTKKKINHNYAYEHMSNIKKDNKNTP